MAGILRVDQANVDYIYAKTAGGRTYIPGHIIQVQSIAITSILTTSPNGSSVAVTGFAASITPTLATSKILLLAQINYSVQGVVTTPGCYFTRNGTTIGVGDAGSGQFRVGFSIPCSSTGDTNQAAPAGYNFLDSPATTSTLTYQLYVQNDNAYAVYFNRSYADAASATGKRSISTITLMEIAQ